MFLKKFKGNPYWFLIGLVFIVLLVSDWYLFWSSPPHDLIDLLFSSNGGNADTYIKYNVANAFRVTISILALFQISMSLVLLFSFLYELFSKNNKA